MGLQPKFGVFGAYFKKWSCYDQRYENCSDSVYVDQFLLCVLENWQRQFSIRKDKDKKGAKELTKRVENSWICHKKTLILENGGK